MVIKKAMQKDIKCVNIIFKKFTKKGLSTVANLH